jgi:Leucine-rich repeat (LRR) protein
LNKNDKHDLSEIQLLTLDLSANKFTEFPFEALHLQQYLSILDLSRNQITHINNVFKIKDEDGEHDMTFKKFYALKLVDLSSNCLT